jgi:hypothetical protein
MRASDGCLYVVKFAQASQPDSLFNEIAGSEMYRWLGLSVPDWQLLRFSDAFLDANPGCYLWTKNGMSRPSGKFAFGSRYLGDNGTRLFEILPGTSISRIENAMSFWVAWIADICALHNDNRQAVFQEDASRRLRAFFVDHGNLFGAPEDEPVRLFAASRYLDSRVYPELRSQKKLLLLDQFAHLNEKLLWNRIRQLPEELRSPTGFFRLKQTVNKLKNRAFLKRILATITPNGYPYGSVLDPSNCKWRSRILLSSLLPVESGCRAKHRPADDYGSGAPCQSRPRDLYTSQVVADCAAGRSVLFGQSAERSSSTCRTGA